MPVSHIGGRHEGQATAQAQADSSGSGSTGRFLPVARSCCTVRQAWVAQVARVGRVKRG